MHNDNPDTIPREEPAQWPITHTEDVFLPAVRVQLTWGDLQAAVEQGAVLPSEAHALWASWAAPGSPLRATAAPGSDTEPQPLEAAPASAGPRVSLGRTRYGFGGILVALLVCLVPLLVWALFI